MRVCQYIIIYVCMCICVSLEKDHLVITKIISPGAAFEIKQLRLQNKVVEATVAASIIQL